MATLDEFGRAFMRYPDSQWRKLLFKAPLILWRLGLGPIMGYHVLVITTVGRKTGLPRHTMTEYHTMEGKIYVPCAFGTQADWYKNMQANPYVTVQTWQAPESMKATRVTDSEELLDIIRVLRKRNGVMLDWYLDSLGLEDSRPETILANKDLIHIIRFDPTTEPTPFPLGVDLAWLWPVLLLLSRIRRRRTR